MWEYKVVTMGVGESYLNQMDADGWELVSAVKVGRETENQATLIFRRRRGGTS